MNKITKPQGEKSKLKLGLMFVMYQVIGIWVTLKVAPNLTASALNFLHLFGRQHVRADYYWILGGTPFFPVQVGVGLVFGWILGRHLRDKSMRWVWVLPFAVLCYAFVTIPTLNPEPLALQAGVGQSRWAHYFGWGCQSVPNNCIDQEVFTAPFYAGTAFSIAAFAAEELTENASPATIPQFAFVLAVGIIILLGAVYDFVQSVRMIAFQWMILPFEALPAAMGAYLILLAVRIRIPLSRQVPPEFHP